MFFCLMNTHVLQFVPCFQSHHDWHVNSDTPLKNPSQWLVVKVCNTLPPPQQGKEVSWSAPGPRQRGRPWRSTWTRTSTSCGCRPRPTASDACSSAPCWSATTATGGPSNSTATTASSCSRRTSGVRATHSHLPCAEGGAQVCSHRPPTTAHPHLPASKPRYFQDPISTSSVPIDMKWGSDISLLLHVWGPCRQTRRCWLLWICNASLAPLQTDRCPSRAAGGFEGGGPTAACIVLYMDVH